MARQRNVNRAVEKTGPGPRNEEKRKRKKEKNDLIVQAPVHLFIRRSWRRTLE